jgi:exopolyphosphatase/guanosine-5'-triphosphate,3'-diphosphate pyrophosphatase
MDGYVPYGVCGIELDRIWIDGLLQHLASLSLEERKSLPGLEEGREDVIIGGTIIVSDILTLVNRERLIVTDAGFLEGVLIKAVVEEKYGNGTGQVDERSILDSLTWKIEKR